MPIFNIAIVGAGPAGYFAAQALQNLEDDDHLFAVDMFERLPTPWGLVRSGVAPDHPKIKSVSKVFEKIASNPRFRLIGNVEVGKDISIASLRDLYDAVVIAVGTPRGRKLGIPGESLANVLSSADIVPWYNGHPDFRELDIDFRGSRAVVIGAGNVAMDVARILAIDPSELEITDTSTEALERLQHSHIREVLIVARRGAESASFTAPELRELPELSSLDVLIDKSAIDAAFNIVGSDAERHIRSNLEAMKMIAETPIKGRSRSLKFLFSHKPIEINGENSVKSITFETADGEIEVPCDLVVTAIGYLPNELSGMEIDGNHYRNAEGLIEEGLYVVGWAKRGPSGVIGTNKSDAAEVMQSLVRMLKAPKDSEDVLNILRNQEVTVINQVEWARINEEELRRGSEAGRPREKILTIKEMVEIAKGS